MCKIYTCIRYLNMEYCFHIEKEINTDTGLYLCEYYKICDTCKEKLVQYDIILMTEDIVYMKVDG